MIENKLAIASISLGQHPSHTLPEKIRAAQENGFQGMEMVFSDLERHAKSKNIPLEDAAAEVQKLCAQAGINIISLAAFENYEGNRSPLSQRLEKARQWLTIAQILRAEHLQIPSNYQRDMNMDHKAIISELQQLADEAAERGIKVAYENLAWSKHCFLWEEAVQIVQEVDRPNFGLCLDDFHIAVALWGDPYVETGRQPDGEQRLAESLRALVKGCPLDKLYYLQLSDGERMDPPYSKSHPWYDPDLETGHVWSNEARPFPLEVEYGGYMPVEAIARAFLVELGFKGWVSLETFDRRMRNAENGPVRNAERARRSWIDLQQRLKAMQVSCSINNQM